MDAEPKCVVYPDAPHAQEYHIEVRQLIVGVDKTLPPLFDKTVVLCGTAVDRMLRKLQQSVAPPTTRKKTRKELAADAPKPTDGD